MNSEDITMLKEIFWYLKLSGKSDIAEQLSKYIIRCESRLCAVEIPDTPPYKIGDEDYRDRVTCGVNAPKDEWWYYDSHLN